MTHPAAPLFLIELSEWFIYDQLCLEEQLLRGSNNNYCIINRGSAPAIVMGIGTQPDQVVHQDNLSRDPIPLIQRFSGGGTVVVDEETLFTTFIFQKDVQPIAGPEDIIRFGSEFYKSAFGCTRFQASAQDYTIDGKFKIGGNAHYISSKRWLSHTSFLWDYNPSRMAYLKHPPKEPDYRKGRDHLAFLERMASFYPSVEMLIDGIYGELSRRFSVKMLEPPMDFSHPASSTRLLTM